MKEAGGMGEREEGGEEQGDWVVIVEGVGREQREMALIEKFGGLWLGLVVVVEWLRGDTGVECLWWWGNGGVR